MRMQKAKFFRRLGDTPPKVMSVKYDDRDYYDFIKRQYEIGYRQIIISSEIMIGIIKDTVITQGFVVYQIEFVEDDEEILNEMNSLLETIEKNPVYVNELIEKLIFLTEKSSIDIQRIKIKGRTSENIPVDMFFQSNGLFGVNKESFGYQEYRVSTLIERCLFG